MTAVESCAKSDLSDKSPRRFIPGHRYYVGDRPLRIHGGHIDLPPELDPSHLPRGGMMSIDDEPVFVADVNEALSIGWVTVLALVELIPPPLTPGHLHLLGDWTALGRPLIPITLTVLGEPRTYDVSLKDLLAWRVPVVLRSQEALWRAIKWIRKEQSRGRRTRQPDRPATREGHQLELSDCDVTSALASVAAPQHRSEQRADDRGSAHERH